MYQRHKHIYLIAVGLVAITATFLLGFYIGKDYSIPAIERVSTLANKEVGAPVGVDFSPFWKAWNVLNDKYYASKIPNDQDKVWGAITGLASSFGDPYTIFMPPEQKKSFDEQIRGNFGGVGMEIGLRDSVIAVVRLLKGNPAEKAGIKAGDKILKIDSVSTERFSVEEAVVKIRGKKDTTVTLTLVRLGTKEPFDVKLIRDVITIPTIETSVRDGIFIIRLENFSEVSGGLFRSALREFIASDTSKLILDLRGNPGGYLSSAVDMASFFLPVGKVVVEERGGNNQVQDFQSFGYDIFNDRLKMVILVDEASASASEILAGALQEYGKAKLLGTRTFGKGSVQELVPITDNTSLKVTVARWYTPQGRSISEGGLTPDYEVKFTEDDIAKTRDVQLNAAISLLLTGQATSTATSTKN